MIWIIQKKVMRLSELLEMGFPKEYLMDAFRNKNQMFAWKIDKTRKNSPIVFDTTGFEEYRKQQIKIEREIIKKRTGVC